MGTVKAATEGPGDVKDVVHGLLAVVLLEGDDLGEDGGVQQELQGLEV